MLEGDAAGFEHVCRVAALETIVKVCCQRGRAVLNATLSIALYQQVTMVQLTASLNRVRLLEHLREHTDFICIVGAARARPTPLYSLYVLLIRSERRYVSSLVVPSSRTLILDCLVDMIFLAEGILYPYQVVAAVDFARATCFTASLRFLIIMLLQVFEEYLMAGLVQLEVTVHGRARVSPRVKSGPLVYQQHHKS